MKDVEDDNYTCLIDYQETEMPEIQMESEGDTKLLSFSIFSFNSNARSDQQKHRRRRKFSIKSSIWLLLFILPWAAFGQDDTPKATLLDAPSGKPSSSYFVVARPETQQPNDDPTAGNIDAQLTAPKERNAAIPQNTGASQQQFSQVMSPSSSSGFDAMMVPPPPAEIASSAPQQPMSMLMRSAQQPLNDDVSAFSTPEMEFGSSGMLNNNQGNGGDPGLVNESGKRRQYIPSGSALPPPGPPPPSVCPSGGPSLPVECDPKRPWPQCPPQSYCFATNTVDIGPYFCCPVWSTYGAAWRPATPFYNYVPPPPPNWPEAMRFAADPLFRGGIPPPPPPYRKSKKKPRENDDPSVMASRISADAPMSNGDGTPTEDQIRIQQLVNDWIQRQHNQYERQSAVTNSQNNQARQ